jgi:hypothetical protein
MEVTKTNKELQDSLASISYFKKKSATIAANCLLIKISDDTTLAIAQQNLSKANELVKSIDEKRKTIKAPYLEAGKKIDALAKELSEPLDKAVEHIKSQVKSWEEARREAERKRQETLNYINVELSNRLKQLCDEADSKEKCDEVLNYIDTRFPKDERFGEFIGQAHALRDTYIQLLTAKKQSFSGESNVPIITVEQEIEEVKKQNEVVAEIVTQSASVNKTRNIRETWKFEVADINQVPMDWLTIDEAKVKAYLAENKETLKDGETKKGIKFFKEISVTA